MLARVYDHPVRSAAALSTRTAVTVPADRSLAAGQLTILTPSLWLLGRILDQHAAHTATPEVAAHTRDYTTGVIGLGDRALRAHVCESRSDLHPWRRRALLRARCLLDHRDDQLAADAGILGLLDGANLRLAAAISAAGNDRTAVPDHLACALAGWLAC